MITSKQFTIVPSQIETHQLTNGDWCAMYRHPLRPTRFATANYVTAFDSDQIMAGAKLLDQLIELGGQV